MTEEKQPAKIKFLSLRMKISFTFMVILTFLLLGTYYWFYRYTTVRAFNAVTENIEATLNGARDGMDVAAFQQLFAEELANDSRCLPEKDVSKEGNGYYPENPLYLEHVNWLKTVASIQPTTRIYTYIKGVEEGEIIAIGSTGYFRDPQGGFKFCQRYTSTTSQIYDGLSEQIYAWEPYVDSFGRWITTYAPIYDDNGDIVGAIGVDIKANYVEEIENKIIKRILVTFTVGYFFVILGIWWASGLITKRLLDLTEIVVKTGEGEYEHDLPIVAHKALFRDEIDKLSEVYFTMMTKIQQRERVLRKRAHQLEIVDNQAKREEKVEEIVESDFFKELQTKVDTMREQFNDDKAEGHHNGKNS